MIERSEIAALEKLEEDLWRRETRFDRERMEQIFAEGFIEFGRSGRVYDRAAILDVDDQEIAARLPLPNFSALALSPDVVLLTYDSAVTYEGVEQWAHRSSIWIRNEHGWQIRFHQGTPFEPA